MKINEEYWTGGTRVYALEDCFKAIKQRLENEIEDNERLRKENKNLKTETYKDEELSRLKSELEKFKKEYYNGFPISEKEKKKISEWQVKHDAEVHGVRTFEDKLRRYGAIGGRYSYTFTPTSIGTVGKIVCSCGEEYCFQEL